MFFYTNRDKTIQAASSRSAMEVSSFLLFFFPSVILFFTIQIPPQVQANTEVRALMDLKSSLDPTNKLLQSWLPDADPCGGSFQGVACNEHRKVANISLQGKGLSGRLSGAVAGLRCLSGLYLHYNSLSGQIPKEIGNLTELTDLYLNVNNFSGGIPPEIGNMASLQVVELCCNQLEGKTPEELGRLQKLSVLALQYNRLEGEIPESFVKLNMLRRLDLSFNQISGAIPPLLADLPQLQVLDVRNNSLVGIVPSGLRTLNEGFQFQNNRGLCGSDFPLLRRCGVFDGGYINRVEPFGSHNKTATATAATSPSSSTQRDCITEGGCSKSSKFPAVPIIAGATTISIVLTGISLFTFALYRRRKQKVGAMSESCEARLSMDHAKQLQRNGSVSPLVTLEYSAGWDPLGDCLNGLGHSHEHINRYRFNLEEIESATHCFSDANLLGRSSFSSVYKGILRDGSLVAVRSINMTSCKSEEVEFLKGLNLLTSLKHENLVGLRGFCCSKARGECFLIYDYAPNGNLSKYLDVEDSGKQPLDWLTRVSIINGIAKGIKYLHTSEGNKPCIVHRNISVEKVLIDQQFRPLIADSGLHRLLADDIVFSALKVSAAMGYLAPEYVTTGRFTEKTDIFAFGVIILQILSGRCQLTSSMRLGAESCRFVDFVDKNLDGKFSEIAAAMLGKLALVCTHDLPDERPNIEAIIQDLHDLDITS